MRLKTVLTSIVAVCVLLSAGFASVPLIISHQGRLLDAADRPVNGSVSITFSLYEVPVAGVALSSEIQIVAVENGLFSVQLSSLVGSTGLPDVPELWLGQKVGADAELVPRLRIGSVPYALTSSRMQGDFRSTPGSIAIGDLTGDGRVDIVTSSDQSSLTIDDWTETQGGAHLKALVSGASPGTTNLSALYLDVDDDGDGHSEKNIGLLISDVTGQTAIECVADVNDDGTPDVGISSSSSVDRAVLKSFFERGDKPTQSDFKNTLDSDGISSTNRSANAVGMTTGLLTTRVTPDSVDESSTVSDGSSSSTYSMKNRLNQLETKLQNIGILARTTVTQACDDTSASISIKRNNGPDTPIAMEIQDLTTSPSGVSHHFAWDSDVDGVTDKEILLDCNDDDAGLSILAGVAIPKFLDITAKAQTAAQNADVGMLMGSGPDTTIEIHSDDNSSSLKMRLPTGNAQEGVLTTEISSTGVGHTMTWDSDANGIIDVTSGEKCDDDGSRFEMTAGVAIPKFIEINARNASSLPGGTSNVSLVMGVGADSLIEMNGDGTSTSVRFRSGTKYWKFAVEPLSSNLSATNSLGVVALDLNGDGRIGIDGAAHATNPVHHSSGAHLTVGGTWTNASDKNAKENFTEVNGEELLEKIEDLPITKWNYKSEDESITHIGPTAQDFKEAFGVGGDDKSISTVDPSGIALAAIKELNKQNQELAKQNAELKKELDNLKKKVDDLASRR